MSKYITIQDIEEITLWQCPYKTCGEENEEIDRSLWVGDKVECRKCGREVEIKEE